MPFMVPIVFALCILLGFLVQRYFRQRSEQEVQLTLRTAIERDQSLSPETIESMLPKPKPDADLRRGVMCIVIALATVFFALATPEEAAMGPLVGLACFPLLIGLAYLLLWRFARQSEV